MTISLIITTYNWPEALKLSLKSALEQSKLPDEIIIADDGSTEATADCIRQMAADFPIPILHSWQPDEGFRAAMSRNRAIAMAKGEYIIMIDGDIIFNKYFIEDHLLYAKSNCFIQGTRVLLTYKKTLEVLKSKKSSFSLFDRGLLNRKNMIRSKMLSHLFYYSHKSLDGIRTCNFSFFKRDCIDVNGFNEDFVGWGREDSEFAVRLINNGIKRRNLKFSAVAYHLFHPQYDRQSIAKNDILLEKAIKDRKTVCKNGIDKWLSGSI